MCRKTNVAVFVRERPLTVAEVNRGEAAGAITLDAATNKVVVDGKKSTFGPYTAVLPPAMTNADVFNCAVLPLVKCASVGQHASIFCFGHTGAGKTHTVMGYGNELGMYVHAGKALFDAMPTGLRLAVKCAEVYNEKVFDLLGGRVECHVKEDRDGVAQIRGEPIFGPNGSVRIKTLDFHVVASVDELRKSVSTALQSRVSGNSTMHAQSSRSHALIELELVTDELVALREAAFAAEADLVPAGKGRDEYVMTIMSKQHDMNPATGQWVPKPGVGVIDRTEIDALEAHVEALFNVVKERKAAVERCLAASGGSGVGGTLVFADLAGAEHGDGVNAAKQTPAEQKERKQINASLLALKECIRSLHGNTPHVPFRNSKLTMLMRRYMVSNGACAAMISNICTATSQAVMSASTLMYSQLILTAGTAAPASSSAKRVAPVSAASAPVAAGGSRPTAGDRWAPAKH